ncbi:zinc ribbon domain-containing protein [Halopiger thermotolerans]
MSAEATTQTPATDEQYCSSCGEIIKKKAEICPECGVRNENTLSESSEPEKLSTMGATGYSIVSIVTGILATLFFPPVFGAISIFCGYKIYQRHRELYGIGLMAFGGITMIIGIIVGMAAWS